MVSLSSSQCESYQTKSMKVICRASHNCLYSGATVDCGYTLHVDTELSLLSH